MMINWLYGEASKPSCLLLSQSSLCLYFYSLRVGECVHMWVHVSVSRRREGREWKELKRSAAERENLCRFFSLGYPKTAN